MYNVVIEEEAKIQRKKSKQFANALAIMDDAIEAFNKGKITEQELCNIAEQLDL